MAAPTAVESMPTRWPAPTKWLVAALLWAVLVLVADLVAGLYDGFGVLTVIGAAPLALWVCTAGWVAYGTRTPARSPNLVAIAACGAATLVATVSFIAPLLITVYPTAMMIVVAAAQNLSRWPR